MNEYNGPDALPIPPLVEPSVANGGPGPVPAEFQQARDPRHDMMRMGTLEIHGDRAALFGALARAQAGYQPIARSRHVDVRSDKGNYGFDYAPLEEVIAATQPALNANGLAWLSVIAGTAGEDVDLHTLLTHESGAFIHVVETMPPVTKAQERGSQITYKRRYQYQCLTGTSPEFDDEGNAADGNKIENMKQRKPPAPPQRAPERQEAAKPTPVAKGAPAGNQEHANMAGVVDVATRQHERSSAKYQQAVDVVADATKQALAGMTPAQRATFTGPTVFNEPVEAVPERAVVNDEPLTQEQAAECKEHFRRCGWGAAKVDVKLTEICGEGKRRENLTMADGDKLLQVLRGEPSKGLS